MEMIRKILYGTVLKCLLKCVLHSIMESLFYSNADSVPAGSPALAYDTPSIRTLKASKASTLVLLSLSPPLFEQKKLSHLLSSCRRPDKQHPPLLTYN